MESIAQAGPACARATGVAQLGEVVSLTSCRCTTPVGGVLLTGATANHFLLTRLTTFFDRLKVKL